MNHSSWIGYLLTSAAIVSLGVAVGVARSIGDETSKSVTREWYEAFQRVEFHRWDAIMASDVLLNSPAGRGVRGLDTFKKFAVQFTDLAYRIDLVDEHLALDAQKNGRGFVTFCLYWKHTKDFGGLAPTGREGTSVETAIFTIQQGKIVRIDVGDNTLDLVIYMWERNWPAPHNVRPESIVAGVDRRNDAD
jgi:hypothetical protein